MTLTIMLAGVIALFGLVGLLRGVRRGVVALGGTLLGAVLVDLWREPLATWLREAVGPERPALPTFLLVGSLFMLTALVVGYGGSVLLPRPEPQARKIPRVLDLLIGGLLGALNGALLVSYLLRYAEQIWRDDTISVMKAGSPVALLLDQWLPWFVIAMVGTTTLFVLLRLTAAIMRGRAAVNRPKPAPAPIPASPRPAAGPAAPPAAPRPQAPPQVAPQASPQASVHEADKRVLDQIRQASGGDKK